MVMKTLMKVHLTIFDQIICWCFLKRHCRYKDICLLHHTSFKPCYISSTFIWTSLSIIINIIILMFPLNITYPKNWVFYDIFGKAMMKETFNNIFRWTSMNVYFYLMFVENNVGDNHISFSVVLIKSRKFLHDATIGYKLLLGLSNKVPNNSTRDRYNMKYFAKTSI